MRACSASETLSQMNPLLPLAATVVLVMWLVGCAPPECAAGAFLDGADVHTCFGARTVALPSSPEAEALFEERLRALQVDTEGVSSTWYLRPRATAPEPNARALFKPRRGAPGARVPLIEVNEAFDQASDDGALLLALVHEYGHVAQYLRGEPSGDELEARLCTSARLTGTACTTAIEQHLARMERDADAFLVARLREWKTLDRAALGFDPWALVDLIDANPPGPAYPPNAERVAPIAEALREAGLARGTTPKSRVLPASTSSVPRTSDERA